MIAKLTAWITGFIPGLLIKLYNNLIDFLQVVFDGLMVFAATIIGWFPSAPSSPSMMSTPAGITFTKTIQAINWVFPISYISSLISVVLVALIAYFAIAPVARWLKLLT